MSVSKDWRKPSDAGWNFNFYELLRMRLSNFRALESQVTRTLNKQLAALEHRLGYGGSGRLGVVQIFVLHKNDAPLLVKVGKVAWSLVLSDSSVPLSTLLAGYRQCEQDLTLEN